MGKNKKKQKIYHSQESDVSSGEQMGTKINRADYITLRKTRPKPLTPNQTSQSAIQLFRNQELFKYISQVEQNKQENKKKKSHRNSKLHDPKQQVLGRIKFNLRIGQNVCLIGGMDKMDIMDEVVNFLEENQEYVFVVRGYAQPVNQKKIYNAFGTYLINCGFTKTIDQIIIKEQIKEYRRILEQTSLDTIIYIVFYDLSNYAFLSTEIQQKFSDLFSLPRVRVIASVQSCKIVLHLSFTTISQYNFAYIDCNQTNIPITTLLRHLPLPHQRTQKTQLQIMQIWKSLNRNQRQIAKILANNQLNNLNTGQENYFTFPQLMEECIQRIILSDDHQLRENLIELTDHRVIIEDMDKIKNRKIFVMKLDRRILESMVSDRYDTNDENANNN